jgi:putative iron-dependent peroxidase
MLLPADSPRGCRQSQAVLSPITEAAIFLVLTVESGGEDRVRELLADVGGLKRSVGFRIPKAGLTCVTGIGSRLWDRMFGLDKPVDLHPFPGFSGARHSAPATAGDLLFHIRAQRLDLCFELAGLLVGRLQPVATVVDEVHGFRSFDERDLLGFVDGTENPEGSAASEAVTIGGEDPDFAGGSYAIVQRYVHDIAGWNALSIEEQERVIGRTKLDDVELPDEIKPANSHVALNTIVDERGDEQQIVRFNMPFGRVGAGELGTYFIGYARTAAVIEQMLTNMFVGNPPGTYDRVLDFSRALTGTLFFVPSAEFLDDPPAPAATAGRSQQEEDRPATTAGRSQQEEDRPTTQPDRTPSPAATPPDGSLSIGSLRTETHRRDRT